MYQTVDKHAFDQIFKQAGRLHQFSNEALTLLFDYLEELAPDYELDVVALCCEYVEDTVQGIANNYANNYDVDISDCVLDADGDDTEARDEVRKLLEYHTAIVGETSDGFVFAQF